jgi:hypothetical protein
MQQEVGKIQIVSLSDEKLKDLAEISVPNKTKYADKYGYAFDYVPYSLDESVPTTWSKLIAIRNCMDGGADWIFWTDIDAVFTNFHVSLESIVSKCLEQSCLLEKRGGAENIEIILSKDHNTYNSGNFFVKNTSYMREFIEGVLGMYDEEKYGFWEQSAIIDRIESEDFDESKMFVPHQKEFNSYPVIHSNDRWKPGRFIAHIPAVSTNAKRDILSEVIRISQAQGFII